MEHEAGWLDWDTGRFDAWVALEPAGTGNRLNDGRADPAGRFWVGSMHIDASDDLRTGMMHRLDADGSHATTRRGIGVSNGLAFSPDGGLMYHSDTLRDTVWVGDYDPSSGDSRGERVFTDFTGLPGRPDGACVDVDGCYWVACVFGSAVARLTPTGEVDRIVELPIEKPTMPAFGGPNLETMYVTSIGGGGTHERRPDQPDAGRLLAIEPGVQGLTEPRFAGAPG
jgi:sugar lactone lactonase YvrE